MVFEETITIECFLGGLTIAINGFTMVFTVATIAFNGFRWFQTIGQTMVSMDRCGLDDMQNCRQVCKTGK